MPVPAPHNTAEPADGKCPWEALYRESAPRLYYFFYAYTRGDAPLAEDLVQETFLSALDGEGRFDPRRANLRTWLWTIARRRLADALRCRGRGGPLLPFEAIEQALARVADSSPPADELLALEETRLRIGGALALLPEDYQAVLRGKYLEDQTVRELALVLGRSEKAVESLLTRAREAFGRQFAQSGPDEDEP